MTAQWRPPESYVHGIDAPVAIIPGRVCAWMHDRLQLDNVRANIRGQDSEIDSVLVAITLAARRWRIAATGNNAAPTPENQQPWVSTTTAAAALGITDSAVRMAIRQGRLPAERLDGRWRITRESIEHYRAARAA